ncbi:hypothetical protein JTE90_024313 [Oedothorax gibbosus]|uniref:HAT C-terminal dimerisation domain-containing protein n=1 Tax=Oedothorax gibbosus TaxID=931172 RepID=A0AAV6VZJ3_9ARAC|nr:hypothetical protein JTE90_024313 [Oedothorax gibbosus]
MVSSIKSVLNVQKPSHEAAKLLKQKLLSSLNNRKQKVLQNYLLCKATLCDPRYMKKYGEVTHLSKAMNEEVGRYLRHMGKSPAALEEPATAPQPSRTSLWAHHDQMVSSAEPSEQGYFSEEMKLYLSRPLLPRKTNPFTFWAQSENAMPGLSAVAFKYLTVIVSLVASEMLVSTLNDVLSDKSVLPINTSLKGFL